MEDTLDRTSAAELILKFQELNYPSRQEQEEIRVFMTDDWTFDQLRLLMQFKNEVRYMRRLILSQDKRIKILEGMVNTRQDEEGW